MIYCLYDCRLWTDIANWKTDKDYFGRALCDTEMSEEYVSNDSTQDENTAKRKVKVFDRFTMIL